MSIGDANSLSREDIVEMGKLANELAKAYGGDPMMTIRVGVLDMTMLLRELVHLRRQVQELQAQATQHVLFLQGVAPAGWNYDHQLRIGPMRDPVEVVSDLLKGVLAEGASPDQVGFGLGVFEGYPGRWFANVVWKAK